MNTEDILKKVKELEYYEEIIDFILSLDLTNEQIEVLAEDEDEDVRWAIAKHPDLPEDLKYKLGDDDHESVRMAIAERPDLPKDLIYKLTEDESKVVRRNIALRPDLPKDLIIKLSCDPHRYPSYEGFEKLENLNTLKSEDLENAYDLIRTSKQIHRIGFEDTFNYIISTFPELSEIAKMFKNIILNGKKDLK
jgi:hypothetical protein